MNTIFLYALLAGVAFIADVAGAMVTKAPKVTASVYEESMPMLYASRLVYSFADVVAKARERDLTLELPDDFPLKDLSRFEKESLDLTEFNDGNGLTFNQIFEVLKKNEEALSEEFKDDDDEYTRSLIRNMIKYRQSDKDSDSGHYLATYRSVQEKVSCVYGVVKNIKTKQIILTFRGSSMPFANRDWKTNMNFKLVKLEGKSETVLVHEGFYNYLFNNTDVVNGQRYARILADIEPLMEEGYSLYITGHSLGGALATMFSFKLAGDSETDWVPRPLTLITYAAPYTGASGYRTAFEQMEQAGLIRSLRINTGEDIVPSILPTSLGLLPRTMKHTGINLRLTKKGMKLNHSSNGGVFNALKNTFFKPVWSGLKWHSLPLHESRMRDNIDALSEKTLDELYEDKTVVSKKFIEGKKTTQHSDDDVEL